MMQTAETMLELVVPETPDPALERALFFAEIEYEELTATVPQVLWTHCLAV